MNRPDPRPSPSPLPGGEGKAGDQCPGRAHGRRRRRRILAALCALPLLALAGCALCYRGPILPPQPLPPEPLLDMHCHVAGIGAGDSGCFVAERLRKSYKFGFYIRSFGVTAKELAEHGDALMVRRLSARLAGSRHVGQAIVLAMDGVVDARGELDLTRTEFYVPNEFVARETARTTNLLFGASINPYRRDALERLEWAKGQGARLVKWLPSIQLIDPADERLVAFYRKLVALDLPLLTHTGAEHSFTQARNELADPERLGPALRLGVRVIAAHVASTGEHGGERDIDRLARMMTQHTNLWADISSLTQINKKSYLPEALRRPEFSGRLLYGSDFPLINMALVTPWVFPANLRLGEMWAVSRLENPWDRDVRLKQLLGVPAEVFRRSGEMLQGGPGHPPRQ